MPKVGIEPTLPEGNRILSPARLPVPPLRRGRPIVACPGALSGPSDPAGGSSGAGGPWRQGGCRYPVAVLRLAAIGMVALGLGAAGCGGSDSTAAPASAAGTVRTAAVAAAKPDCPAAWRAGWQALADEVRATTYCPSWMPKPLRGKIGGPWFNGRSVSKERAYLVSFAWFESGAAGVQEVHVNFRGYPGRTAIPVCEDTLTVNGKTVHPKLACFSDPRGSKRFGATKVTVYTANQGADLWHVLYAWHHQGSLYSVSEHVTPPYTYKQVVSNLDRIMRGLVPLAPSA